MTLTDKAASFARTETEEGTVGEQWRPIETAPKDGTWVLLWFDADEYAVSGAWMRPGRDYIAHWCAFGRWTPGDAPTHWMPLPAPPASEPRS